MAKIKQGILGGFTGKVAGLVGTSWKGRAVMKSLPQSVSNPKTEKQVTQRARFSQIAELAAQILTTFVQPVENPIAGNISGYNLFVKQNKTAFDALGVIHHNNFKCGGGKIVNVESVSGSASAASQEITLTWDNGASLSPLRLTDTIYAAVFKQDGTFLGVSSGEAVRSAETLTIDAEASGNTFASADVLYVLYAAVSTDGRDVSALTVSLRVVAGA